MCVIGKPRLLVAILAAVLCAMTGGARGDLDEEISFGCGLVEKQFSDLGVEVLDPLVKELGDAAQKRRAYEALAEGHGDLALRPQPGLSREQENAFRKEHEDAVAQYWKLLTTAGAEAPDTVEGGMGLVNTGVRVHARVPVQPSEELRKEMSGYAKICFETAIKGLEKLTEKAARDVEESEEKEPEPEAEAHKQWLTQGLPLKDAHLKAGVELNRARYSYCKTLPPSDPQRKTLLEQVDKELGDLCWKYDSWMYTVVGYHTLASALNDLQKYSEAYDAGNSGMDLIGRFMEQGPDVKKVLLPWSYKMVALWAYSAGKIGRFEDVEAKTRDIEVPGVQLARAEVLFIKAQERTEAQDPPGAERAKNQANVMLNQLVSRWPESVEEVRKLQEKYSEGTGYVAALNKFRAEVRGKRSKEIVTGAVEVLRYGDVPAVDRRRVLMALGAAYWQEQMRYEAFVVYTHLAETDTDDDAAERYARSAVGCLQDEFRETGNPVDGRMLEAAQKWQRDGYGGPGKEYADGLDAKKAKDYLNAIELFQKVPADSLYYEAGLEQIGECYVLLAKKAGKANAEEAAKYLEKGRSALLGFLEQVKKPSPIAKIQERRKRLKAAAVYRLTTIDLWEGKENYAACLERTDGFIEKFPETVMLHPYIVLQRVRCLAGTGELGKAQGELRTLEKLAGDMEDTGAGEKLLDYGRDLVFRSYAEQAGRLGEEASQKEALAKKADKAQGEVLRKEAAVKKAQSLEAVNNGLNVIMATLTKSPGQMSYEQFVWVVRALHETGRNNELRQALEVFLKKFGDGKGLTPKQIGDMEEARVLLGTARYQSGEYQEAYRIFKYALEGMEEAAKKDPRVKRDARYAWLKLNVAKSAKALAGQSKAYRDEAMEIFVELRGSLESGTGDWWDVSVGILEIRNARGEYADNLWTIGQMLPRLKQPGEGAVRNRYILVLEEIYRRAPAKEQQEEAMKYLLDLHESELDDLGKEAEKQQGAERQKLYKEIVRVVQDFRLIDAGFGGTRGRELFRKAVDKVIGNATDEETKKAAERLRNDLRGE